MTVKNVDIVHEGAKIVLPLTNGRPMDYDTAIEWLERKKEEDSKEVGIHAEIPCSPMDGLVAFSKALSRKYGWVDPIPTKGFFGSTPPTMVTVPTGVNDSVMVPWGKVQIPGVDGYLATGMETCPTTRFIIKGIVRKRHESDVQEVVALTRKILQEESIYKSKAVKVSFEWERKGEGYSPIDNAPKFISVDESAEKNLIFSQRVKDDINIGLFAPIENTAACREHKIPLKRGILLYGPYGTGKTLTANAAALKATRNGWTFIYLDTVKDLQRGLEFAAQYAPAVLFAEDIDRVVSGERSEEMDDILNTLDGVDTKSGEIITVFTTNHVETMNPAVLRMGRLDSLIEVSPPDAKAAEELVTLYARGLLGENVNLERVGLRLAGKIPAFIREVVERAKIAAIARLKSAQIKGEVAESDLLAAAGAMETHNALIWGKDKEQKPRNAEVFVRVPENHATSQAILSAFANGVAQ